MGLSLGPPVSDVRRCGVLRRAERHLPGPSRGGAPAPLNLREVGLPHWRPLGSPRTDARRPHPRGVPFPRWMGLGGSLGAARDDRRRPPHHPKTDMIFGEPPRRRPPPSARTRVRARGTNPQRVGTELWSPRESAGGRDDDSVPTTEPRRADTQIRFPSDDSRSARRDASHPLRPSLPPSLFSASAHPPRHPHPVRIRVLRVEVRDVDASDRAAP